MQILSKKITAARAGISERHLERLIACGEGPAIIQLGRRRVGVAESDFEAWIASRRRAAPGKSAA